MSENKAFTLKLDIKVYSNLSAIIFSANQRSLVFGNRGVIPSEAPKLSQANIRVRTQRWSFKMWEQQAWFKCASHHLGAKKIWVNNYKRLAWENCVYMAGPKTQRWWLSKKSSLFWAVYGFCFIQRPLPTSKTKWFCEKQAQHTGYCTQLWCWPRSELHEGQNLVCAITAEAQTQGFCRDEWWAAPGLNWSSAGQTPFWGAGVAATQDSGSRTWNVFTCKSKPRAGCCLEC